MTSSTFTENKEVNSSSPSGLNIILNPRDRMNSSQLTDLPENKEDRRATLEVCYRLLFKKYGGKISYVFDPKYVDELKAVGFKFSGTNGLFSTREDIEAALRETKAKDKTQRRLDAIAEKKDEFEFLSTPHDFNGREEELYEFKKANAPYVNPDKESKGIYSVTAEREKIKNPANKLFAITHKGKIIACSMLFISHNIVYESDIIVAESYRNQGFRYVCIVKIFEPLLRDFPNLQGYWVIPGGDGQTAWGKKLSIELFRGKPIDEEVARKYGFGVAFEPAGPRLLKAANCHPDLETSLDPRQYSLSGAHPSIPVLPEVKGKAIELSHSSRDKVLLTAPKTKTMNGIRLFSAIAVGASVGFLVGAVAAKVMRKNG